MFHEIYLSIQIYFNKSKINTNVYHAATTVFYRNKVKRITLACRMIETNLQQIPNVQY